jgi:hypothetical protein
MTLFVRVAIPCRAIPLLAVRRARLYDKQQNTGYTQITSSRSNSRLCDTFLFLVCGPSSLQREKALTGSLLSQYLIPTKSSRRKTRPLLPFILTMKILSSIWVASRRQKVHRQFVSAGTEIPMSPKSSSSVRLIARTGLGRSRSRHASRSRKKK